MLSKLTQSLNFRRFAKYAVLFVLCLVVLAPVTNILGTPVAAVAHAADSFCDQASTCLTSIVYLFAVYLPTNFAYAAGYLFNFAIQLGLNSGSYALDFLSQGWAVVRDVANLAFIFILIYIAYTVIVEAETAGTMRTLASVVVMALLINFSFFMTRVVIDAGNLLSVQFYNAIPISATIDSPIGKNTSKVKDLTAGVMNAVKIQGILGNESFKAFTDNKKSGSGVGTFLQNVFVQTLVFVAIGILLSLLGFIFLIVGIKFMVRIVVLWIAIIASPLAFAAHALPGNKQILKYYKVWEKYLIESSFYPAVFLFLFFIFTLFINAIAGSQGIIPSIFAAAPGALPKSGQEDIQVSGVISIISNVGIRVGLITVFLYYAMKFSDSFSEVGSSSARGIIGWAGGKIGGVTSGAAGWAGRNTAGRAANAAANSQTMRNAAANSIFARPVMASLKGIANSSFDARGTAGLKAAVFPESAGARLAGVKIDAGRASGKGGFAATSAVASAAKRRAETSSGRNGQTTEEASTTSARTIPRETNGRAAANDNQPHRENRFANLTAHNDNEVRSVPKTEEIGKTRVTELEKQRMEKFAARVDAGNWQSLSTALQNLSSGAAPLKEKVDGVAKAREAEKLNTHTPITLTSIPSGASIARVGTGPTTPPVAANDNEPPQAPTPTKPTLPPYSGAGMAVIQNNLKNLEQSESAPISPEVVTVHPTTPKEKEPEQTASNDNQQHHETPPPVNRTSTNPVPHNDNVDHTFERPELHSVSTPTIQTTTHGTAPKNSMEKSVASMNDAEMQKLGLKMQKLTEALKKNTHAKSEVGHDYSSQPSHKPPAATQHEQETVPVVVTIDKGAAETLARGNAAVLKAQIEEKLDPNRIDSVAHKPEEGDTWKKAA